MRSVVGSMGSTRNTTHDTLARRKPGTLLETVVALSDDAIVVCDGVGRITSWGSAAERIFGHSAYEAKGQHLKDLFADHLRGEVSTVLSLVQGGECIRHFETEITRPDGLLLPVSLSLSRVDESGPEMAVVVIARDLTEQHLAQATLAEVDARVEEGEALAHVGSWMWDVRTGAIQWSAELHRIHGIDPLEFDGTLESHLACVHPDDRAEVRTAMLEAVRSGQLFDLTYRVIGSTHVFWNVSLL